MVTGVDLPLLFKKSLMAEKPAVALYEKMAASQEFLAPRPYQKINPADYDALLLPGGHDKGMRPYLESKILQNTIVAFFENQKPVAAICHGTLLAARSISSKTGKSVLWGRKTTGLTRNQEMTAYWLTRLKLGDYYRTYDAAMADELKSFLKSPTDYDGGPGTPIPMKRDSSLNFKPGFTVRDGNYLSARWPGDAYTFARDLVTLLSRNF